MALTSGNLIEADLLIVSIGVKPNRDFLAGSPLCVQKAIRVNKFQETEIQDVFAAGDVCLSHDIQSGEDTYNPIWPNAVRQGKVAAYNMAGIRTNFPGSLVMNSGEFMGLWVNMVGSMQGIQDRVASRIFSNEGCYQRLYLHGKQIVKYVSIGNIDHTGVITNAIRNEIPVDALARQYPANRIPVIAQHH